MKLQHLAIIFVIIILPISMVVTSYIQTQIDTISVQTTYSSKLQNATYDAIKAFQLNTINNRYSSVSDSKIRDIEASISTFFNSIGTKMGMDGIDQDALREYVPAMLYVMYDGYYIYGKYRNESTDSYQYGLKPYIYYSCRYIKGADDFVVNYSLDNTITIYGTVDGQYVTKSGYLINPNLVSNINETDKTLTYDGETIEKEVLSEQIVLLNEAGEVINTNSPVDYQYIVYQNAKIYYDPTATDGMNYFWYTANKKQKIYDQNILNYVQSMTIGGNLYSESAFQYYKQAYEFSTWVEEHLGNITQSDARDMNGDVISDFAVNTGEEKIFRLNNTNNPLLDGSTFNENRISVIRRSIQTNLATAIANYNQGGNQNYEFVLPVFTEEDWDKIVNNITVASFLQGIPIGSKFFNNYCIITNDKNEEVVTEDSLYIITQDGEVHLPTCKTITNSTVTGVYSNVTFERQSIHISDTYEVHYYPHANSKCYDCMVNVSETYDIDGLISGTITVFDPTQTGNQTINMKGTSLRKQYLAALGRERYDLYRTNDYFGV